MSDNKVQPESGIDYGDPFLNRSNLAPEYPPDEPFKLCIKTTLGDIVFSIEATDATTVFELKEKIERQEKFPAGAIELTFDVEEMENHKRLGEFHWLHVHAWRDCLYMHTKYNRNNHWKWSRKTKVRAPGRAR